MLHLAISSNTSPLTMTLFAPLRYHTNVFATISSTIFILPLLLRNTNLGTATVRNLVYTPVKDRAARHTAATHSVPESVHQKENVFT